MLVPGCTTVAIDSLNNIFTFELMNIHCPLTLVGSGTSSGSDTKNLETMEIEIINRNFKLDIYGFGDTATNKDHVGTAFKLSGKMWEIIKANGIKNKGMNIWVYETADNVFTGVELENDTGTNNYGLEKKKINLKKYAYYKHIGPYNLIKQAGQNMKNQLVRQGFEVVPPYIEIYGHWTGNEAKSETELLMCVK